VEAVDMYVTGNKLFFLGYFSKVQIVQMKIIDQATGCSGLDLEDAVNLNKECPYTT
jgi:hypothetical protein